MGILTPIRAMLLLAPTTENAALDAVLFISMLTILALLIAWVGVQIGKSIGAREQRTMQEDAAAAICPTCSAMIEPAKRLRDAGIVVTGISHGLRLRAYKGRGFGAPQNDANTILRIAKRHVERLERRA